MKLGFLGPIGTFSEYSAIMYGKRFLDCEFVPFSTIHDVILAVSNGVVDEGIVPFENSIEGTVNVSADALIFEVDLFIKAEIIIPVSQNLMVRAAYNGEKITKILSHPQGIAQCTKYLREYYADSELKTVSSTAEAARLVSAAGQQEHWAAIAPMRAAEVYGLKILGEIQDDKQNQTRFIVLTKQIQEEKGNNEKTSIVFSTENKPGELYKILDIISIWDLNMTKIESRPMKNKLGTYVFFVDLESANRKDLEDALKMVERKSSFYKYLGSYPVFH